MTSPTEDLLRKALEAVIPAPGLAFDPVLPETSGFGRTVFGFNQVALNGIVTNVEFRGPDSKDGFVPHLKVWVAVPALVPVVFSGSPGDANVKHPDRPAASLGVPGITHMQKIPVIISGKSAAQAWGQVLARYHMVWVSGQLVPILPFEPGVEGFGVLATQLQVSSAPIVWDTRVQGARPWDETYTDAFYKQLAVRRLGTRPKFTKLRGKAKTAAVKSRQEREKRAKEDADKQFEKHNSDLPWKP